ncbi:MAG: hypothetical protein NT108_02800 [Candidatus Kaiserbacteria bacterium]|nr:hypothetical protein [Candidatus Kaiserbacteria bacterium]
MVCGFVVPMPTLPVEEMKIVEVAWDMPASLPTRKLPLASGNVIAPEMASVPG